MPHDRLSIGPRISIRGATGSGKTTLGHTLGQRFGLPVVDIDAIYWLPNLQVKPLDQFRTDVKAALDACPQGWICIGNYSQVQDLVLSQADTVLWLRLPFRVSFWRLCKRTVTRAWTKQPLWEGHPNRETCSRYAAHGIPAQPYPHAKILSIHTSTAQAMPGVIAVVTGDDLSKRLHIPVMPLVPGMQIPPHPLLAHGVVHAAGVPVAAVVAPSRALAKMPSTPSRWSMPRCR